MHLAARAVQLLEAHAHEVLVRQPRRNGDEGVHVRRRLTIQLRDEVQAEQREPVQQLRQSAESCQDIENPDCLMSQQRHNFDMVARC